MASSALSYSMTSVVYVGATAQDAFGSLGISQKRGKTKVTIQIRESKKMSETRKLC